MLRTFIPVDSAEKKKDAFNKAKTTPRKTSSGKENRPVNGKASHSTKIPAPVKAPTKGLSEKKIKDNKTTGDRALQKIPLPQTGKRERNAVGVSDSCRKILLSTQKPKAADSTEQPVTSQRNKTSAMSRSVSKNSKRKIIFEVTNSNGAESQETGIMQEFKKLSAAGPIRRINFKAMHRSRPYSVFQEKKCDQRKNEELSKLTFEQKLSIIINSRPGLDGDRNARVRQAKIAEAKEKEHSELVKKNLPLGDTTSKVLNKHGVEQSFAGVLGENAKSGRPAPKLPRQLCEVNYISPRKQEQAYTSQRWSARKSPCRTLAEIAAGKDTNKTTPLRNWVARVTPCKIGSASRGGRVPSTAKAQHCSQINSSKTITPLKDCENSYVCKSAQNSVSSSSAMQKKSVRWADVLERKKSDAHKKLNFENENSLSVNSQEEETSSCQLPNLSNPLTGFAAPSSSINTATTKGGKQISKSDSLSGMNGRAIPKPFDVEPVDYTTTATDDWNTPPNESQELKGSTNVPFVSPMDNFLAWLKPKQIDSTPVVDASTLKSVPNCPLARRTWARTPHAKEERMRQQAELENTMNQTVLSSEETTSSTSTSSSTVSSFVTSSIYTTKADRPANAMDALEKDDTEKSEFQMITERILSGMKCESLHPNPAEMQSKFDLSRGILQAINDINKWSIDEDIKRVTAGKFCREKPSDSNSKRLTKVPSDNSINSVVPQFSDSSSDTRVSFKDERVKPNTHNVTHKLSPSVSTSGKSISSESLTQYLTTLPDMKNKNCRGRTAGLQNVSVVYSTAPMRPHYPEYRNNDANNSSPPLQQAPFLSHGSWPIKNDFHTVSSISRGSSQSDISSGYVSQEDPETKISAIVHNFMRPVHQIIGDAFNGNHVRGTSNLSTTKTGSTAATHMRKDVFSPLFTSNGSAFKYVPSKQSMDNENLLQHCSTELLDAEVAFYTKYLEVAQRLGSRKIESRACHDPVAKVLMHGDCYHFVPIDD